MPVKSLEDRTKEAFGAQAWLILCLQHQVDVLQEKTAEQKPRLVPQPEAAPSQFPGGQVSNTA